MKNSAATAVSVVIAGLLIGGAFMLAGGSREGGRGGVAAGDKSAVTIENGVQIIDISAKGGYYPRRVEAQAGVPTKIRVTTRGTFDCSAALTIPAIGYSGNLPLSGSTDIDVPPQEPGTTLRGLCSMGMYSFAVDFI